MVVMKPILPESAIIGHSHVINFQHADNIDIFNHLTNKLINDICHLNKPMVFQMISL